MYFAIVCNDKPDSMDLRLANRPAHVDYLKAQGGRVRIGGPFTTEDGAAMTGSLIILEAADLAEAQAFAAGDPYNKAGLFASVEIRPWRWILGAPEVS